MIVLKQQQGKWKNSWGKTDLKKTSVSKCKVKYLQGLKQTNTSVVFILGKLNSFSSQLNIEICWECESLLDNYKFYRLLLDFPVFPFIDIHDASSSSLSSESGKFSILRKTNFGNYSWKTFSRVLQIITSQYLTLIICLIIIHWILHWKILLIFCLNFDWFPGFENWFVKTSLNCLFSLSLSTDNF